MKILPDLTRGIEIIGFINPFTGLDGTGTYVMIVDLNDGMILGVSEDCNTNFGIPSKFCYGFAQEGTEMNVD